jgi:hypothetical protein
MLLEALGKPDSSERLLGELPPLARVCLAVICVPAIVMLLWWLNGSLFDFLASQTH